MFSFFYYLLHQTTAIIYLNLHLMKLSRLYTFFLSQGWRLSVKATPWMGRGWIKSSTTSEKVIWNWSKGRVHSLWSCIKMKGIEEDNYCTCKDIYSLCPTFEGCFLTSHHVESICLFEPFISFLKRSIGILMHYVLNKICLTQSDD